LGGNKIYVRYAERFAAPTAPPEPECTSVTKDIIVPGLHLVEEFISNETETVILNAHCRDNSNWLKDILRRVKHFGYKFNYNTRTLDTNIFPDSIPSGMAGA